VDITGAATVQGTAQALNLDTCADFAKGESPGGDLQLPGLLGEDIGGQEVSAVNEIREYAGPGTYEKESLRPVAGVIDVSIGTTPYQPTDDTTAQAVINADGSGSFTFTDLKEGEQGNPTTPKGGKSVRRTSQSAGAPRSDGRPCAVHAVSARWSQIPCQAGLAR
jgi:hypothetical protein